MIEKTLLNYLKDKTYYFIFPTQLAADLWQDRIIQISDIKAVASERFIAWDKFKAESIKSKHQDKTAIPSTMRKVFASTLIQKNANSPFLQSLIIPEYAKTAGGFVNWITNLLPSLSLWKKYFEKNAETPDEQDSDLQKLYDLYKAFLDENKLFDPAWETPPFEPDGRKYFIFYPEILSDYAEYETILKESPDITIINLEEKETAKPDVILFSNSRIEIKNIANYIRKAHYEKNIPWTQIAISIPNIETYGPYIERELSLLEIPHILRNATPLASTGAGNLFTSLLECYSTDFAYDSLKSLLLNTELPWNCKEAISQLLDFGQKNHCICSFEENGNKIDVWEESFRLNPHEELAFALYKNLKKNITAIVTADSFSKISENYFIFKNLFFDETNFSKRTDLILSRCIIELGGLIDLEKSYNFSLPNAFSFFTDYLNDVQYLENKPDLGVNLLPYKTGACVPYACHILIDSSQASLSVIYKQLSFLREDKRQKLLRREDSNITQKFIRLYSLHSTVQPAYFTAAVKTFDSYAQTSSYLNEIDFTENKSQEELYGTNPYIIEKNWLLDQDNFPSQITNTEKISFNNWISYQDAKNDEQNVLSNLIEDLNKRKIEISQTQLNLFYECPRKWLFQYAPKLSEEDNSAELVDKFLIGNINHKVFENYFIALKKLNLPIHTEFNSETNEGALPENYRLILSQSIDKAINNPKNNPYLQMQLLQTTKNTFDNLYESVHLFSKIFEGCKVISTEDEYVYEPEDKNYILKGRIDCLLQNPVSKEYFLVDFKASAKGIPDKNMYFIEDECPKPDFQIPMYVDILKYSQNIKISNAAFYNVSNSECVSVFGTELARRMGVNPDTVKDLTGFEPTINKVHEFIDNFADSIYKGNFNINPDVTDFQTCSACAFKAICRRTFIVNRKN